MTTKVSAEYNDIWDQMNELSMSNSLHFHIKNQALLHLIVHIKCDQKINQNVHYLDHVTIVIKLLKG